MRLGWLIGLGIALAGCGGGASVPTDAGTPDAPGDAPNNFTACSEFETTGTPVPAHVNGMLSGQNNVESPSSCTVTNAPYGTESAGPDSVVLLTGLVPGTTYVVRVQSPADLLFYIATGCSTATGPSNAQCLLFEDASTTGDEVGTFVAPSPSVYVVVDYYASHAPPEGSSFTLDVYAQGCTTNAQCSPSDPVCSDGACVQCVSSFDCLDPAASSCDPTTNQCVAAVDQCDSDDPSEPADDGPAGATVLVPDGTGYASQDAHVCSAPQTEGDFYAFDVTTVGDSWEIALAWTGTRDLDLQVFDATGEVVGLSYWEQPEHIELTYLAVGRYYAYVDEFSSEPDSFAQPYTISVARTPGPPCQSATDCAQEFRNQVYRGNCSAGACVDIDGNGAVPAGGACDSLSDCAAGLDCPSFYFVEDSDTREICAPTCTNDSQCGVGYVCTTYLEDNFCVLRCTDDLQCPTILGEQPDSGPWDRLGCQQATGRCLP